MSNLGRLLSLSKTERRLMVRAALTTCIVEVGIRLVPLPSLARRLGIRYEAHRGFAAVEKPKRIARSPEEIAVGRVLRRWPLGDTCLRRALVLGTLTSIQRPTLHVGVAKSAGDILAHAWLSFDHSPVQTDARGLVFRSLGQTRAL